MNRTVMGHQYWEKPHRSDERIEVVYGRRPITATPQWYRCSKSIANKGGHISRCCHSGWELQYHGLVDGHAITKVSS